MIPRGANLIVQVKGNRVLRVVPFENEAVNECWIADRDRFSYEALNSDERLTTPMLKQGGQWTAVDWQTALEYVASGLKQVKGQHGPASIGLLASPHSTLEELHLAGALVKGLGSPQPWMPACATRNSRQMKVCVIWAHRLPRCLNCSACWWWVRICARDHPLFAQRIRQARAQGVCRQFASGPVYGLGDAGGPHASGRRIRLGASIGGCCRRGCRAKGRRSTGSRVYL
jgi:NADH-quinone oxidoreductase subunit G